MISRRVWGAGRVERSGRGFQTTGTVGGCVVIDGDWCHGERMGQCDVLGFCS